MNTRPTAQKSIAVCFPVAAEGAGDVCWRGATDGAAEQRRRIGVRSSRRYIRQRTRRGCTALWQLSKCKSERWKDPGLRENETKLRVWEVPATLNTNKQINSFLFSTSTLRCGQRGWIYSGLCIPITMKVCRTSKGIT